MNITLSSSFYQAGVPLILREELSLTRVQGEQLNKNLREIQFLWEEGVF